VCCEDSGGTLAVNGNVNREEERTSQDRIGSVCGHHEGLGRQFRKSRLLFQSLSGALVCAG